MHLIATRKSEQNRSVVDPWTVVHFSAGLALGLMDIPRDPSLAVAVLYEGVEQWIERTEIGQDFFNTARPENALNAVVDVAVFALGHWLGGVWNRS